MVACWIKSLTKWLIKWDGGCGQSVDVVEYDTHADAINHAYEEARQEAESQMDYSAEELTDELIEEWDLED